MATGDSKDKAPIDTASSHVSFELEPLDDHVGVVYIVTNDYHGDDARMAIRDQGRNCKRMKNFFYYLVDKYHITPAQNTTYDKFVATCKYIANWPKYKTSCKRIIIYFSGHGNGDYISMEEDRRTHGKRRVNINDILKWFRGDSTCANMQKILLLEACYRTDNIKCEENELVACAASSEGYDAESFPATGGLWTQEFWTLSNSKKSYDLVKLLQDVKDAMKSKNRNQVPSFKNELGESIIFTKCTFK